MEKQYKEVHIITTDKEIAVGEKRNDWNYEIRIGRYNGDIIGKLYRSRSAAARFANTVAEKVVHWYPF